METYINNAACRGAVPSALEDCGMKSRRFLVAKLLSARTDARLLVAPTGFGKSILAAQYASLVFSFWHVFWLDCQDLRFLRALNEGTLDQLIHQRDPEAALVVFDDVPSLSPAQAKAFAECAGNLLVTGCEVLACSTPVCAESFVKGGAWNAVASSKALLVQSSEQDLASTYAKESAHAVQEDGCGQSGFVARIPAINWGEDQGAFLLVRGFALDELPVEDVLAGLLLFGAGSVPAAMLSALPVDLTPSFARLVRQYPYFAYEDAKGCYETLTCDDALFERVVMPLCAETISFLEDEDAHTYARCFVNALLATGNSDRACSAALALLTRVEQKRVATEQALSWAFSAPDAFERMVEKLACACPANDGMLAATALFARAAGKEAPDAALDVDCLWVGCANEQFSLEARCLYAALALRAQVESPDGVAGATDEADAMEGVSRRLLAQAKADGLLASWQVQLLFFAYALTFSQAPDEVSFAELIDAAIKGEGNLFERRVGAPAAACKGEAVPTVHEGADEGAVGEGATVATAPAAALRMLREAVRWFAARSMPAPSVEAPLAYQNLLAALIVACWCARDAADVFGDSLKQEFSAALVSALSLPGAGLPQKLHQSTTHALSCLQKPAKQENPRNRESTWDYHVVPIPHLHVNLWGCFSANIGSRTLDARSFKRKKSIVLLAILASEKGRGFNRDYLVELLWPESPLSCARRNFHAVWSDLRQGLRLDDGSCPYLIRSGGSYQLDGALVDCDAQEAEHLCRCLRDAACTQDQWDRAFLQLTQHFSGEMLPGAPENECIARYCCAMTEQINDALMVAAQALFDRGDILLALQYAKEVSRRSPEREDACGLIMQSQISLGQSVSALNTFLACQRFLAEQLGVKPSPAICALYEQALGGAR